VYQATIVTIANAMIPMMRKAMNAGRLRIFVAPKSSMTTFPMHDTKTPWLQMTFRKVFVTSRGGQANAKEASGGLSGRTQDCGFR
jgi:hypothetical protein